MVTQHVLGLLCRELCATEERLELLRQTLQAHLKLSSELHPLELEAYAGREDPVAEALSARRAALHAVLYSYQQLKKRHLMPKTLSPSDMSSYYAWLEVMLRDKDRGMQEFHEVQQGEGTPELLFLYLVWRLMLFRTAGNH